MTGPAGRALLLVMDADRVLIVGAAALLLCACGQAPRAATPSPSPKPTVAPVSALAWRQSLAPLINEVGDSLDRLQTACAAPTVMARCQAAYADVSRTASSARTQLEQLPPPPCMQEVAQELRDVYQQMSYGALAASRATSVDEMNAAAGTLHEAIGHMQSEEQALSRAAC